MGIDRRLRDAGEHLRETLDGPAPPFHPPAGARRSRWRPGVVLLTAAAVVAVLVASAVAWTRDDGGSVVTAGDPTSTEPATATATTTAVAPVTAVDAGSGCPATSDRVADAVGETAGGLRYCVLADTSTGPSPDGSVTFVFDGVEHGVEVPGTPCPVDLAQGAFRAFDRPDGSTVVVSGLGGPRHAAVEVRSERALAVVPVNPAPSTSGLPWRYILVELPELPELTELTGPGSGPSSGMGALPRRAAADPSSDACASAPPATPEAEIETTIAILFNQGPSAADKLAQLDHPDGLDAFIAQGMADERAPVLTVEVREVVLQDPDRATATVAFFLRGMLAQVGPALEVVRTDAGWQAERDSYCVLVATGGPPCPARP